MNKNNLALNLSKTSIQLLNKSNKKSWDVLGSVDPSSKNLAKDLNSLRNQAAAISTKRPIVDILLPRELVLSQTIVIEDDFSIEHCKKVTAKRCGLNENEILLAIGDAPTKSTIPIAAISVNSITESRNFVRKAGFRTERYLASSKISGFKKSPVFFNDNSSKRLFDLEGKTFTNVLTLTSVLLFAGFLISLTSAFLEYRSNNRPYNYLAESRIFYGNEKSLKTAFTLLREAKKGSSAQPETSFLKPKDPIFTFMPQKQKNKIPDSNSHNQFSIKVQISANLKTTQIKEQNFEEIIVPVSNPEKPNQFDDFKKFSKLQRVDLLNLFLNQQEKPPGSHPRIDDDFSYSTNRKLSSSKKAENVSTRLVNKMIFPNPIQEKGKNHKYKNIAIEEIFSDISLTKILIKTANKRASTLPLLYFDTQKPDIPTPNKPVNFNFTNNENKTLISPNNILREEFLINTSVPTYGDELTLDYLLNVKLKEQGLDIKLLRSKQVKGSLRLALWKGKKPILKPKIIDSIKVLEDPTRSTGAVTFVELPPKIPSDVSKLKRVAASSISNLSVRTKPPSIPKRASIVGNSTLKNLIELNRTNLIGIFGKRTGRIALIRLSSGNTVKVKVGQQFGNGWRVISIDLDKIHITNGSRQETLRIPG